MFLGASLHSYTLLFFLVSSFSSIPHFVVVFFPVSLLIGSKGGLEYFPQAPQGMGNIPWITP